MIAKGAILPVVFFYSCIYCTSNSYQILQIDVPYNIVAIELEYKAYKHKYVFSEYDEKDFNQRFRQRGADDYYSRVLQIRRRHTVVWYGIDHVAHYNSYYTLVTQDLLKTEDVIQKIWFYLPNGERIRGANLGFGEHMDNNTIETFEEAEE